MIRAILVVAVFWEDCEKYDNLKTEYDTKKLLVRMKFLKD